MNFGTAASLGLEALKHGQGLGPALTGVLGASKLTGQGFEKVALKLGLPAGLGQQAGQALDQVLNPSTLNGAKVLDHLQYFDADKNGQISRAELTQGMQKLQELGLSQTGSTGKLYQMGEQMLKSYDRLAGQDGNVASVSYQDMGKLMAQDGAQTSLSVSDWNKL